MKVYTDEGIQELADKLQKPVCAWIPCHDRAGNMPIPRDEFRWIRNPKGSMREYERTPKGGHEQRKVFRPRSV